jgi:hypothetical protein
MQTANQRQIDFEELKITNIKVSNESANEFSKFTKICITVTGFSIMFFLAIKLLS